MRDKYWGHMRLRHKNSHSGSKTQKRFADLKCSNNWLLLKYIDYSIGFLPCKAMVSIPCSRQVGIEPNAPTMMGMNSNL